VAVPPRLTDMLAARPADAHAWRLATREIFQAYLSKGYRATDFAFPKGADRGLYLLEAGASGP
jgi:predicted GNAT superfamily acetyltransferase